MITDEEIAKKLMEMRKQEYDLKKKLIEHEILLRSGLKTITIPSTTMKPERGAYDEKSLRVFTDPRTGVVWRIRRFRSTAKKYVIEPEPTVHGRSRVYIYIGPCTEGIRVDRDVKGRSYIAVKGLDDIMKVTAEIMLDNGKAIQQA